MTRQWAIPIGRNLVEASGWHLEIANLAGLQINQRDFNIELNRLNLGTQFNRLRVCWLFNSIDLEVPIELNQLTNIKTFVIIEIYYQSQQVMILQTLFFLVSLTKKSLPEYYLMFIPSH